MGAAVIAVVLFVCLYALEYDLQHMIMPYLKRIARAQEKLANIEHPSDEKE